MSAITSLHLPGLFLTFNWHLIEKKASASRELVVHQRHHRGLVRRDGRSGEYYQPVRQRAHGRHTRHPRTFPESRLEPAVSHDERIRLRLRRQYGRTAQRPTPLALYAGLQDAA